MNEQARAHQLIDLAMKLVPEGEGIDLTDLELSIEETVRTKAVLSRMRSAIDNINRGLAEAWAFNHPDTRSIEVGDELVFLAPYKGKRWTEGGAHLFVEWVLNHPDEAERALSASGIKVGKIPPELRAQVLDEAPRKSEPRIQTMPTAMTNRRK